MIEMNRVDKERQRLKGKKALVVGAGRSGISAALLLKKVGCQVTISESNEDFFLSKGIFKGKILFVT